MNYLTTSLFKHTFTLIGICIFLNIHIAEAQNPSGEALKFASQQMIDLRIDHIITVNSATKISNNLYEVEVTGMGASGHKGLLYRPDNGNWVYLQRTRSLNYDLFSFSDPALLFALEKTTIDTDETTPNEVQEFLKPYFDLGKNLSLNRGLNLSGVWYPKQVEGTIGNLIKKMGLTSDPLLTNSQSGHAVQKPGGLLFRASYDHLALQKAAILSLNFDLGVTPSMADIPGGMKLKEQELDLIAECQKFTLERLLSKTSASPLTKMTVNTTDCELKIQNEVRIDVNGEHLYFDTSIALRKMMSTNRSALEKKTIPLSRTTDYAIEIEGDLRGGVWKDILGKKGFNLQQVKLQAILSLERGWSVGVFGALDFGDQTRVSIAALLPVSPSQDGFGNVGFEGSISKISLEQIAMFPAAIGGPKTYPKEWKQDIKASGIDHYGLQNVKLSIAPTITDPSLGIEESGTTFIGTLILADQAISSLKINVSDKGVYFDEAMEPFKIGWFELKNARFKGFIPSKKTHNNPDAPVDEPSSPPNRDVKFYANQNKGILYFDTVIELDGNTERAYLSMNPINAGIGFEANISPEIGAGFLLKLDLEKLKNANAPFDVYGYFHRTDVLSKEVHKIVSSGVNTGFNNMDKTYQTEQDNIKLAEHKEDSLKNVYYAARKKAQETYDKDVAPLEHAEHILESKKHELDHLKNEANHWKHKARSYHWYEFSDIAHAYYEEGKYWAEYNAYKASVEAAELVVKSLELTTHFIAVDADPVVVSSFAEYNGARYALAIAKGALDAAQKANAYVKNMANQILEDTFQSFSIEKIDISGQASAPGEFDLNLNFSGSMYGKDWSVSSPVQITTPDKATQKASENLKAIEKAFDPMPSSLIVHAKSTFHSTDYARYPAGVELDYKWELIPGSAADIAASDQTVFVNNSGGFIYQWNQADSNWSYYSDARNVIHLDAKGNDQPIVVNNKGVLYYRDTHHNDWVDDKRVKTVYDVGIGEDGTIWVTTVEDTENENQIGTFNYNRLYEQTVTHNEFDSRYIYSIYRKKPGQNWEQIPGSLTRIDVDKNGNAWGINHKQEIYRWVDNKWERIEGHAVDIGVGGGNVWVVNSDEFVYHFLPKTKTWVRVTGQGRNVSVDGNGHLWLVDSKGEIYKNLGPR